MIKIIHTETKHIQTFCTLKKRLKLVKLIPFLGDRLKWNDMITILYCTQGLNQRWSRGFWQVLTFLKVHSIFVSVISFYQTTGFLFNLLFDGIWPMENLHHQNLVVFQKVACTTKKYGISIGPSKRTTNINEIFKLNKE